MVRHKYMGQLTLAVIESEGGLALHNKQSTAGSAGTRFRGAQPRTNRTIGEQDEENVLEDTRELSEENDEHEQSGDGETPPNLDWRQYFNMDELTSAFEKIQRGEDPVDEEATPAEDGSLKSQDGGSESCPSDDNLDMKELYNAIYLEKNKMNQAIKSKQAAEGDYERNFANFVKKVTKKLRNPSKDPQKTIEHLHHLHKDGETCERCKSRLEEHKQLEQKKMSGMLHLEIDAAQQSEDKKLSKGKPTLLVQGQSNKDTTSVDPPDPEQRKGRQFIINKRSSAAAMSPNPNRTLKKALSPNPNTLLTTKAIGSNQDGVQRGQTIKDRRLRSQEARLDSDGVQALKKPAPIKQHQSKVTGITMALKTNTFAPILNHKASIVSATQEKENLDLQKQGTSTEFKSELRVSDSNYSRSLQAGPNQVGQPNVANSTIYSNAFPPGEETIMDDEGNDRGTPMGVEPSRPNMAARTDGFNKNGMMMLSLPSQDFGRKESALSNQLQSLTTQKLLPDHIGNNKKVEFQVRQQQSGSQNRALASFNQPMNLNATKNYTSQFVNQPLPTVQKYEQELLKKNQMANSNNQGNSVQFGHQGNLNTGNNIQLSNSAAQNSRLGPCVQNVRSPAAGQGGMSGMPLLNVQSIQKTSRSPGPPNMMAIKPPIKQGHGSAMLARGISGTGVVGQATPNTQIRQFRSPQQDKTLAFQRPQNTFKLGQVNQSQHLAGGFGSSMQITNHQQQASTKQFQTNGTQNQLQMRSPRRNLAMQNNLGSQGRNAVLQGNQSPQGRNLMLQTNQNQQVMMGSNSKMNTLKSPTSSNYNTQPAVRLKSPGQRQIAEQQRIQFQKQYQQQQQKR